MKVYGEPTRSIRSIDGGMAVEILDQTSLPFRFEKVVLTDWRDCVEAIREMRVRGTTLTGIAGAWAMVLATLENPSNEALKTATEVIVAARPTSASLACAVHRMYSTLVPRESAKRFAAAVKLAEEMTQEDVLTNRAIGDAGKSLIADLYAQIRRPVNILTVGNSGWLSTVDYGTALSPVYMAFEQGTPLHVWTTETRPCNQGLLSAWEMRQVGVPHALVVDGAVGQLMQQGDVDLVIVGASHMTRRGDFASEIGTYLTALAANDNEVPFYVAAPSSVIDWHMTDGKREIAIENRSASEVLGVKGLDRSGNPLTVELAPIEEAAANPAFDVTHNRFVTGIITERGVIAPVDLATVFADKQPKN